MDDPRGTDWSDTAIDLIIADYFAMLADDLTGRSYGKSHHNAALQALTGRSHGSIEFKHCNISAVLRKMGMRWIPGYKPMANFQAALIDGVDRWFATRPDWWAGVPIDLPAPRVSERPMLWIGPAPDHRDETVTTEPAALISLLRKFDPAERDARNRELGKAGEERAFHHERGRLLAEGRDDLARHVRWVAAEDGDGAGYDIYSFEPDGRDRLLEVKTTTGWERTPFHLTRNECAVAAERPDVFRLLRLYDFAREARAFEIAPPLDRTVTLTPTTFLASF